MTHPAILALLSVTPKPVAAFDLLAQLSTEKPATVDDLLAIQDEIMAAISDGDALAYRSQRALERCLKLKPSPASKPPTGF